VSLSRVGLHHVKPAEILAADLALKLLALVNREVPLEPAAVLERLAAVRALEQVCHWVPAHFHFTYLTGRKVSQADAVKPGLLLVVEENVVAEGEGVDVVQEAVEVVINDVTEPDVVVFAVVIGVSVVVSGLVVEALVGSEDLGLGPEVGRENV